MISLLYHSHTLVPAHLAELETLAMLEPDEQVLVAIDGVLLDSTGRRVSGPTLHDYCLITNLRVVLWARDYSRHQGWAFPLSELSLAEGAPIDPLHAELTLVFAGPDGDEQFTLTLMPTASLPAALRLLQVAGEAACSAGDDAHEIGPAVFAALSEQIFGHADAQRPGSAPYRWDGAAAPVSADPNMMFQTDPSQLPPGQIYAAGRLARSAWDTLRRSLREAELPFDLNSLNSGSLRDLTEAVRAINELVHTVSANPNAQQMAMAFLNRQNPAAAAAPSSPAPTAAAPSAPAAAAADAPETPEAVAEYHEIPLRRKAAPTPAAAPSVAVSPPAAVAPSSEPLPDRREIPLRRRATPARPTMAVSMSGSGDRSTDDA